MILKGICKHFGLLFVENRSRRKEIGWGSERKKFMIEFKKVMDAVDHASM